MSKNVGEQHHDQNARELVLGHAESELFVNGSALPLAGGLLADFGPLH